MGPKMPAALTRMVGGPRRSRTRRAQLGDGGVIGHIAGHAHDAAGEAGRQPLGLGQLVDRAGHGHDVRATLRQPQGDGLAQAATAAGHDRDAALLVGHGRAIIGHERSVSVTGPAGGQPRSPGPPVQALAAPVSRCQISVTGTASTLLSALTPMSGSITLAQRSWTSLAQTRSMAS